jgi:nucleoside-diphosphate-sugar epimerase
MMKSSADAANPAGSADNSGGTPWPEYIRTEAELDDVLTRPRPELVECIRTLASPLVILGAGGKMGPTLALLARRAAEAARHPLEIIAVSRFREPGRSRWFESHGIRTLSGDLLEAETIRQLPDTENLVYLVGLKFGTKENPAATWVINTLVPVRVVERYPQARIVALSTGNVYPLSVANRGGSVEEDPLTPQGEYAFSAVARERVFEHFARRHGTPIALLRLFYAVELRYGVLVDVARSVHRGEPIDLANGYFNCIWQGDANEMILRAFPLAGSPPSVWNLCRPEVFSVRTIAEQLGRQIGQQPRWINRESETALLGNPARLCAALGPPGTPIEVVLRWTGQWIQQGGRLSGHPTHFEVRDGQY